ncbi:tRNA uridine-5-carboxymethylaminomethyl(34) synthesis GTPase MnmE [Fusibacter sp. JL216-2]|uniref:tRNA uridine-5-carboxymethylaminomethyl(34) synthesis GTPase MnmE n=1 Tax=Fusibacter sp. JL216-2 TaxID=3071453 RepID=UPI003D33DBC8
MEFDTIVAVATAPGEGAIGIIRLSGDEAQKILHDIFRNKKGQAVQSFESRKLTYGHIVDENEHVIDEVLVTLMRAPKTYTREDVVEIHCHGGVIPLQSIVKRVLRAGARMADVGEFTKRAFLNGRLDLAQAESVMDLISAKTPKGFDVAFGQLEGSLSKKVASLRDELVSTMAQLEVCIDYPEEDIEEITYGEVVKKLSTVEKGIDDLLSSAETGRIIRDGLSTVIVGKPNVGKSSLLNALLKEARAIVTDIPGTTRDVIEEFINIKGVPLKLIDTAGIRETEDVVEKIGVEKSKSFFNQADLVIFVVNASEPLTSEDEDIIDRIGDKKAIIVVNKIDLPQAFDIDALEKRLPGKIFIRTSMMNEEGIEDVETQISEMVFGGQVIRKENAYVSNIRHIRALEKAKDSIRSAIDATESGMPYDFIEVDTKDTYQFLGEVTGETVEDDMMTKIFSNFCLGK